MLQAAREGIHCGAPSRLSHVLLQPFPKSDIERLVTCLGHQPGSFDQVFVSTQSDIFSSIHISLSPENFKS